MERLLRRGADLFPQDAAEHYNRAIEMSRQGDHVGAEEELRLALAIRPEHAPTLNNLGLLLLERGALDEAIGCFQDAIRVKPDYCKPYNNLGVAYLRHGHVDWAIVQFKRALLVNPVYQAAQANLGSALGRRDLQTLDPKDARLARQAFAIKQFGAANLTQGGSGWIPSWLKRLFRR